MSDGIKYAYEQMSDGIKYARERDKVIAAAKKAGGVELQPYDYGAKCDRLIMQFDVLERFYAIAYEAGRVAEQERCAHILEKQDVDPSFKHRMADAVRREE